MIDLFKPYVPPEAIHEVVNTLKSRWIGQAHKVDAFEREFEKKFNTSYAIALSSGSAALETAYKLCHINPEDEVITTPLTCTATNIPLLRRRAKIVWADISPHTLCLDPVDIARKITPRTRAIVNVHLGGIENDIGEQPVPVVSDACQALGVFKGTYHCFSFQAIKHITTGDGGMLIVPTPSEAHQSKLMRWFGIDRQRKIENNWQAYTQRRMTFDIETIGYKRQMTDIAASMGLAGLLHYDRIINHRRKLFLLYKDLLRDVDGLRIIDGKHNTCWLCTLVVQRRDDFAQMLFDKGIDTNLVQVRNDIYAIFGGYRRELPVMDYVEDKYLSIPLGMHITHEDVEYICDCIKKGW